MKSSSTELRAAADRLIAAGEWLPAQTALGELWRAERTSSVASFLISRFEQLNGHLTFTPCRLAILRSFTVEPMIPLLRAAAYVGGIELTVHLGGFGTYAQEMLDPQSALYQFQPDVLILALQTRDVLPALWEAHDLTSVGEFQESLRQWLSLFRSRSTAAIVLHNLEKPAFDAAGVLGAQALSSQSHSIEQVNQGLAGLKNEVSGLHLLDYDALVSRHGRERWHDERKWLVMRMPIAAENLLSMAEEWLRFLHPLSGRVAKVLVTDLDNTLWGGVLGEDGLEGLRLGREYPGAGYLALQRVLLDIGNRGILLAVASKNNADEALRAIEEHPEMLLRRKHFAALEINWNSKVESLRRIASELNVGLDSLVFVDDNPVERENIRQALPEVTVIELPADAMAYAKTLRACPMFERLSLSAEDRERGSYYAQEQQRKESQSSYSSMEDFYRSLEQKVTIARLTRETLPRVAQLLQKTNQFNLTTRRHNAMELERFLNDPAWEVYTTQVVDRFGDNGLVGVCITRRANDEMEIDSFLLSCRVIGRTVEDAMLHFVADQSRLSGAQRLKGWFLPTRKNKPAENFYQSRGFQVTEQTDAGTLWSVALDEVALACPPWLELMTPVESSVRECAHA